MTDHVYPEHERLQAVASDSQKIGEFLEWLNEQKIQLAHWHELGELVPHGESVERLLARYFQIDLVRLEREKREMLKAHLDARP